MHIISFIFFFLVNHLIATFCNFFVQHQFQYTFAYAPKLYADKAPSEATFRGSEFLSYDLGQTGGEPIVSAQDAISLYFRTRQPNGLLFYTSKWISHKPNFVSMLQTYSVSYINHSSFCCHKI